MQSACPLSPLPGYLVLERLGEPTKPGAVVVAESYAEKPQKGRVLAVWDVDSNFNDDTPALNVQVGSTVLFRKYGPVEFDVEGVTYVLLEQADVYAVILQPTADHVND